MEQISIFWILRSSLRGQWRLLILMVLCHVKSLLLWLLVLFLRLGLADRFLDLVHTLPLLHLHIKMHQISMCHSHVVLFNFALLLYCGCNVWFLPRVALELPFRGVSLLGHRLS